MKIACPADKTAMKLAYIESKSLFSIWPQAVAKLELGAGFAFVGRQVHLDVAEEDFYIDLLFYHLRLRSFVVVDLKTGPFRPEYAGKINFYCNLVDDHMRHTTDNPSIGISEYELTRALPEEFKSSLPTIEEIEATLSADLQNDNEEKE